MWEYLRTQYDKEYLCKMIKGKSWQSLSIQKGKSKEFNDKRFSKRKHKGHFTDEIKEQP